MPAALRFAADLSGGVAFAAICASMLMTVGDIAMRIGAQIVGAVTGIQPGWGLYGLIDLTQLTMMIAAPLAIAATFFLGGHIRVDLVFAALSRTGRQAVLRLSALIGLFLMGLCLFTAWSEMRAQLDFTTTSAALGLAYTWYWAPLLVGFALSVLACTAALFGLQYGESHDV